MGPGTTLRGLTDADPRVSGRVRDLAVSDDGTRIYAAAAGGGVWYSGDSGNSWLPVGTYTLGGDVTTDAPSSTTLAVGALHVRFDPNGDDPVNDEVWAGTGEPDPRGTPREFGVVANFGGIGILHASGPVHTVQQNPDTDPWEHGAQPGAGYPGLRGQGVYAFAADPADPAAVIAGTTAGLHQFDPAAGPLTEPWSLVTVAAWEALLAWQQRPGARDRPGLGEHPGRAPAVGSGGRRRHTRSRSRPVAQRQRPDRPVPPGRPDRRGHRRAAGHAAQPGAGRRAVRSHRAVRAVDRPAAVAGGRRRHAAPGGRAAGEPVRQPAQQQPGAGRVRPRDGRRPGPAAAGGRRRRVGEQLADPGDVLGQPVPADPADPGAGGGRGLAHRLRRERQRRRHLDRRGRAPGRAPAALAACGGARRHPAARGLRRRGLRIHRRGRPHHVRRQEHRARHHRGRLPGQPPDERRPGADRRPGQRHPAADRRLGLAPGQLRRRRRRRGLRPGRQRAAAGPGLPGFLARRRRYLHQAVLPRAALAGHRDRGQCHPVLLQRRRHQCRWRHGRRRQGRRRHPGGAGHQPGLVLRAVVPYLRRQRGRGVAGAGGDAAVVH